MVCFSHDSTDHFLVPRVLIQHFNTNPYFEDTMLKKSFTFPEEGAANVVATSIKWKEGMVWVLDITLIKHTLQVHLCFMFKVEGRSIYRLIVFDLFLKGLVTGVNHKKKGNKRELFDERLD